MSGTHNLINLKRFHFRLKKKMCLLNIFFIFFFVLKLKILRKKIICQIENRVDEEQESMNGKKSIRWK